MKKPEEDKHVYSDINETLRTGMYNGWRIIDVVRKAKTKYMLESVSHRRICVTHKLQLEIAKERERIVEEAMHVHPSNQQNASHAVHEIVIKKIKASNRDTKEPCIHTECWCARNGCRHVGRKTCDVDNLVEMGIKEMNRKYTKS